MDLLNDPWIPVRASNGTGALRLLTYEEALCADGDWRISLPRDDLELACLQLLVCMTQVMFVPATDGELRRRLAQPLNRDEFAAGVQSRRRWFDLDHADHPFMQTRKVRGEWTSIQKLFPGLPERTSQSGSAHAFFNDTTEIEQIGGAAAAIALFNLASNSPSFGGGFKGTLRGGAPVTIFVAGSSLREQVWANVLTLSRVRARLPWYEADPADDQPTWVQTLREDATVHPHEIGLMRGLFWQPSKVELCKTDEREACGIVGEAARATYSGFRKTQFRFALDGLWPHPHGAMLASRTKGVLSWRFASFTTTAPAWTMLSEFIVPRGVDESQTEKGCVPSGPVTQMGDLAVDEPLHLIVGGYRADKASIEERRHELISVAQGWADDRGRGRLEQIVRIGLSAKSSLAKRLRDASDGRKAVHWKGLQIPASRLAEQYFYGRSESLIHQTLRDHTTFGDWKSSRASFVSSLIALCREIFNEISDPFARKPELIPAIAWARRALNADLAKLVEEVGS